MRRYSSIVIIFIGLFVAMACDESSIPPDPAAAGNEYFPVGSDRFFIYDVEEVNYLLGGDIASTTYQLKEEWQFSFISDNDSVYVIYQYTRPSDMDVWQPASTLQVRKSDFNIALTEGNTPYVKLAFPVA